MRRLLKSPWTCVLIPNQTHIYDAARIWCVQNVSAAVSTIKGKSYIWDGETNVWFSDIHIAEEFKMWLCLTYS